MRGIERLLDKLRIMKLLEFTYKYIRDRDNRFEGFAIKKLPTTCPIAGRCTPWHMFPVSSPPFLFVRGGNVKEL